MRKSKLFLSLLLVGAVGTAGAQSIKDAKIALEAEQYDKAKEMLTTIVTKKPKTGEAYFYLGNIHIVNDKLDSATIVFEEGVENSKKKEQNLNLVGLGLVDLQRDDTEAAEEKFKEATEKLGRREYLPLYYAGKGYVEAPKPDYEKGLEYLKQAEEKNDKDPDIKVSVGDAYLGLGENSPAYVAYRDALNIDPDLVRAKLAQAIITRSAQAYDVAFEQLEGLTEEYPNYAPTYRELAETYYLSSLQMEQEEYRETNKKAVEAYQKYLSLAGDESIEAKTRYADFLVYSGNYEELKEVSEELADAEGVDAKVYRYLGYIAYNDKDYAQSVEYLETLFDSVEEERLIARDYLFAGLANVSAVDGDHEKGIELLNEAVKKQEEDPEEEEDLLADIAETAFDKYQQDDQDEKDAALRMFAVPASMPESDYYFDSNYYLGQGEYSIGSRLLNEQEAEAEEGEEEEPASGEAKEHLQKAIDYFAVVIEEKNDHSKRYFIPALYYTGLSQLGLDNLQDPEAMEGLFVDSFTQLLEELQGESEEDNQGYITDANNYLGYFSYAKGDDEKAKEHFEKTLELDPENEFAQSFIEIL